MFYSIRHVTKFSYDRPISESVMEVRMQPRSEGAQRCQHFGLSTIPSSRVMMFQDHDANIVHHFNIPSRHEWMLLTADALVECVPAPPVPWALGPQAWSSLDSLTATGEYWDDLAPSVFARPSRLLGQLRDELQLVRGDDPLSTLRRLTEEMFQRFAYSPQSTRVDSPIDDALESRRGVCQDFSHIFIALARELGVPCRYISGYLFHEGEADRSSDGATHAWAEAFLPDLGWIGFDPTNNLLAADRHIRVAIGRDYADVPPTRGVYKGLAGVKSELAVAVNVGTAHPIVTGETLPFTPFMSRDAAPPILDAEQQQQ
jgi:transglutaminase-like putative cysteine protease